MLIGNLAIAKKHIDISIRAKQIAAGKDRDWLIYIATHAAGISGQSYQQIEEASGEEFWSIKAWTPAPHRRLKDPDVIITDSKRVKFLVEVKWGTIPGKASTDLLMSPEEWQKIARLIHSSAFCRVRGPAVEGGRRYRSHEFRIERDYWTDGETKLILITDFLEMQKAMDAKFQEFLRLWKQTIVGLLIADLHTRIGEIPSFQEILEGEAR